MNQQSASAGGEYRKEQLIYTHNHKHVYIYIIPIDLQTGFKKMLSAFASEFYEASHISQLVAQPFLPLKKCLYVSNC